MTIFYLIQGNSLLKFQKQYSQHNSKLKQISKFSVEICYRDFSNNYTDYIHNKRIIF